MTLVANLERLGHQALAAALKPPDPIDYLRFAEDNIAFGPGEPRPGGYDRRAFRYFDSILEALGPNDPARIITLCASAQIGKTILGNVFALGSVVMGRGTVLIVHPGLEGASRWSKMKLSPMMRSTPAVSALFPQRPRDAADSVLYKARMDGFGDLLISGANSAASLSQVTAPYVLEDDLSKWTENEAGDAELQADSRARAHSYAKIFKISTPLTLPNCKITRNFEAGSREMPYISCVHCGHMHVLEWANFHPEQAENPFFVCPACGGVLEQRHRQAMLNSFEWRAENPAAARTHRSFWLWSAYSVLQDWSLIVAEWNRAQGDGAAEQVFSTDVLGKAFMPKGDGRPPTELAARAERSHYARGEVPEGGLILTLAVDCQLDRIEWQLVGHGEGYRRFVIDIGTIDRHISEPGCQRDLDLLMRRRWTNFRGRPLEVSMCAIDAGWSRDDVVAFTHRYSRSRVVAVRGVPGDLAPRVGRAERERSEKTGEFYKFGGRPVLPIGIYQLKSSLYRDLVKDDPSEKGYIAFPNNLPFRYFEELVSERRVPHRHMGVTKFTWEKISDRQANECHDTIIYATAAALHFGVNRMTPGSWADLRARLESASPPPPREPQPLFEQLAHTPVDPPRQRNPSSEFGRR
jgi:phage terminase large subunit GpA-like protein